MKSGRNGMVGTTPVSPVRSQRGNSLRNLGNKGDSNSYEESIYRAVMGPDGKVKDAY